MRHPPERMSAERSIRLILARGPLWLMALTTACARITANGSEGTGCEEGVFKLCTCPDGSASTRFCKGGLYQPCGCPANGGGADGGGANGDASSGPGGNDAASSATVDTGKDSADGGKDSANPGTPYKPPVMLSVPAGSFEMGAPETEVGSFYDERPVHTVTITRPFLLKKTEVTQGEWMATWAKAGIVAENPSKFKDCGADCPVDRVSWKEAVAYCNALSRNEGLQECYTLNGLIGTPGSFVFGFDMPPAFAGLDCKGYRLPTEAEWEYAARAGTTKATYNGNLVVKDTYNAPVVDSIGWYGGNSGVSYAGGENCSDWKGKQYPSTTCGTHPVGLKKANPWGFYDMLGNVYEFCWDGADSGPYDVPGGSSSPLKDPLGNSQGQWRVTRGGAWLVPATTMRAAGRYNADPSAAGHYYGLRPARTL